MTLFHPANNDYEENNIMKKQLMIVLLALCMASGRYKVGHNFFCGAGNNPEEIKGMIGRLTYALNGEQAE